MSVASFKTDITPRKAVRASVFVIFGFGLSQVIRLAGNLILTRLLVPEFFGIIALVQVFIMGIGLFSDIGLEPGVIRSMRFNDSNFINTAWTLQVIRGPVLWVLSLLIAYPISVFYNEPKLFTLIPFVGLYFIVEGLKSTSVFSLNKHLHQGTLTIMEIVSQIFGLSVTILFAYMVRSVWALALGGLVTQSIKTVWSHVINKDVKHKLTIEKTALKELISFGIWIFFSTAMMFLATQSDRLILGKIFTLSFFGVYNIAVMFAEVAKRVVNRLGSKVIFPYLANFNDLPRKDFRTVIKKHRRMFVFPMAVFVGVLTGFGDSLILMLYDPRYYQAAWVLPMLAIGMWPLILSATIDMSLFVVGKPKYVAFGNFSKFIYMLICVPVMYAYLGIFGAVLAVTLNDIPLYLFTSLGVFREGLSQFKQDFLATCLMITVVIICITVRYSLSMGLPGFEIFTQLNAGIN